MLLCLCAASLCDNGADCRNADRGNAETQVTADAPVAAQIYLRLEVAEGAVCRFSYSADGAKFISLGAAFTARPGRWIGAKMGLFAIGGKAGTEYGYADFEWFHVQ